MATIYDIKIEGVSYWTSYNEEIMRKKIRKALKLLMQEDKMKNHSNEMEFPKIEVNIKA